MLELKFLNAEAFPIFFKTAVENNCGKAKHKKMAYQIYSIKTYSL